MILRRIASNLKKHDWSSALVEVSVVVVGIIIGLQVDDWNQTRKNRLDEQEFLVQLHEDLLLADQLSSRVRERRMGRLQDAMDASDVLFDRVNRNTLTDDECTAIAWSTAFNVIASALPSVDELIATGRVGIIRDSQLRTALVALRQSRTALDATISEKSTSTNFRFLPAVFPDLIQLNGYFDDDRGEVASKINCDLESMRKSRPFLTQFSANVDGYDSFIRDGLRPWSSQFDRVHEIVDEALTANHELEKNN